jgi:GNAT superfamily N-acetyltransferase
MSKSALATGDMRLIDGRQVTIRTVQATDRAGVEGVYARCNPEMLRMRFFTYARDQSTPDLVRLLRAPDGRHLSLAALVDHLMVGVGCYERVSDRRAEFALVVDDEHHSLGVGTLLLEQLMSAAHSEGIATLCADVLAENALMLRVLRDLGAELTQTLEYGVVTVEFPTAQTASAQRAALGRKRPVKRALPRGMPSAGDAVAPGPKALQPNR